MQGVVLAAGRGTRLGALTLGRSKAMLPVLDRPLVRRVLDSLAPLLVEEWLIVASPGDSEIVSYFQGEMLEAPVRIVHQPEPKGTADALRFAAPFITGDFALSACDNLAPSVDIQHMLARWQTTPYPDALLSLLNMLPEEIGHSSTVVMESSRVTRITEKPGPGKVSGELASLPLYLFTPALLEHLESVGPSPRGEYELQDAINKLIAAGGDVEGIQFSSRQTLTSTVDLLALNRRFLASGLYNCPISSEGVRAGTLLVPPICIEPGARIGSYCRIGPEVYLESGCRVGDGVRLERVVVLRGGEIPAGRVVIDQVVAEELSRSSTHSTG